MSKFNQSIVEVKKIINDTPFSTIWKYSEVDLTYILSPTSSLIVRTNDRILSGSSASIILDGSTSSLPVGTYSIGTASNPYPLTGFDDYTLISITVGYVSHILNNGITISKYEESNIPNSGENNIEWYCELIDLIPIVKTHSSTGYTDGASYSSLKRR